MDKAGSSACQWKRPAVTGLPPARGGHSATIVGNLMIVFGGTYRGDDKFVYCSDVWVLDLDSNQWHCPKIGGKAPAERYGHAATVIGTDVYIFGGKGGKGMLYNDLWCLDVTKWSWSLMPSTSAAPAARMGCSLAGPLLLFGGWDAARKTYNDLWLYDRTTFSWVQPKTHGTAPSARHGHSCVFDEVSSRLLVYGGCAIDSEGHLSYLKDTRELDLNVMTWGRTRISGTYPTARYWHTAVLVGNVMVVSGGYSGDEGEKEATAAAAAATTTVTIPHSPGMGFGNVEQPGVNISVPFGPHAGTFLLDTSTGDWQQPFVAGKAPGYRYGASAVAYGLQVIMFGGWEDSRALYETLVLDLSALAAPAEEEEGGASAGGSGTA